MNTRFTDAFRAGLHSVERVAVQNAEPLTYTVIGTKPGPYEALLYDGGRRVGRGEHPDSALLAIAAALESADDEPAADT